MLGAAGLFDSRWRRTTYIHGGLCPTLFKHNGALLHSLQFRVTACLVCFTVQYLPSLLSCSGFPAEDLYGAQSAPLSLPGARGQHTILPLFQSANSSGKTFASEEPLCQKDLKDTVVNAGGPVWAMGWCPSEVRLPAAAGAAAGAAAAGPSSSSGGEGGPRPTARYLAVSARYGHCFFSPVAYGSVAVASVRP